ncbi:hypothetical protein RJ641_002852 [Dillenia turbinata]|uniref:Uncharacterized protein n=1 Tax=Dillenia turbinata TaxID=194707 RepID=A0AAN8VCT0_9MAGN
MATRKPVESENLFSSIVSFQRGEKLKTERTPAEDKRSKRSHSCRQGQHRQPTEVTNENLDLAPLTSRKTSHVHSRMSLKIHPPSSLYLRLRKGLDTIPPAKLGRLKFCAA